MSDEKTLNTVTTRLVKTLEGLLEKPLLPLEVRETGAVTYVAKGIARVSGLPTVRSEELVLFREGLLGLAFNLDPDEIGVVLLGEGEQVGAGDQVRRTHRLLDLPVGDALLGRVVDALGRPLDGRGPLPAAQRRAVEQPAPGLMERQAVTVPLQTGLKVVDALLPIGRGQRELILGDRQTGKTALAVDAIINQRDYDVLCVYCAIGQRRSAVAKVIADLRHHHALDYTVVLVSTGDDPPGLQYISPYAATSIAEHFLRQGRDVLIVYDDLTHHARAYRELSLLLRRPPGREAYPGDIFFLHSRLLERATNLKDDRGGSLTALPIIQTEAQNISAYIPTNLISITDGQIYLSPDLQQKGLLPAVDVGRSVSRVGGKAQLPAYQEVAGDLRLSYAQFEELEAFSRFGTRLDEDTRRTIERGRRIRESLKQPQFSPLAPAEQLAILLAAARGLFDHLEIKQMAQAEQAVREAVSGKLPEEVGKIHRGERLSDEDRQRLLDTAREALTPFESDSHADA